MAASDLSAHSLDSMSRFHCIQACGEEAQTRILFFSMMWKRDQVNGLDEVDQMVLMKG